MVTLRRDLLQMAEGNATWLHPTEDDLLVPVTKSFLPPAIFFMVVHMSVVMTLAVFGNLFLIVVILRGNHAARRRTSPVQVRNPFKIHSIHNRRGRGEVW
jgi:hypothetical protein